MDILTLITVIGGIILTIGYLPQLVKLKQTKDTNGISMLFWYLIALAVSITAINLVLDSAPLVLIVIQVANATLAIVVLLAVHLLRQQYLWMFSPTIILIAIILLSNVLPLETTQSVASIAIVAAYISQLVVLFVSKNVSGVSPTLYLLIALGLAIMATKMFVTKVSLYIITTELINIGLLLLCAGAFFYQSKRSMVITINEEPQKVN